MTRSRDMSYAGSRSILCLEDVRLLRYRAVRRHLKKVDTLAVFRPYGKLWERNESRHDLQAIKKSLQGWQCDLEKVSLRLLSQQDYFPELIKAGEEAVRFLDGEGSPLVKDTPIYQGLHALLQSEAVLLAVKKLIVNYLRDRIQFCMILANLAQEVETAHILVAPAYEDIFDTLNRYTKNLSDRVVIPTDLLSVGRRRERVSQLKYLLFALAGIPIRLTRRAIGSVSPLSIRKVKPISVRWAKPIILGFDGGGSGPSSGYRRDDNLEDNKDFAPVHFLYVHEMYRYHKETIKRWQETLRARGAAFVDILNLRMPLGFYCTRKIPASWQRWLWCLAAIRMPGLSKLCEAGHSIVEAYVEADLFMQYYRPKVYDTRDDFHAGHIVRTIVFNRYGCRTIGIPHGAYSSLGLNPYAAYTFCDTFCLYGPVYERIWQGTWSHSPRRVPVGIERNDYTHAAIYNERRRAEFQATYNGKKVLLWCTPAPIFFNNPERVEETFKTIVAFLDAHSDWFVIVRPRPGNEDSYVRMVKRSVANKNMVVLGVAEEPYSIYEMIAYADAIVASNLSTVGIEAICAGRQRVVIMNYLDRWPNPYAKYFPNLVLWNAKDLAKRLEVWARDECAADDSGAIEAFKRDFDVGFDGQARHRYKREMLRLAGLDGDPDPA